MMALPVPKVMAKPTAQNRRTAIARLTRIFATTLPTFFILEKPTSSIAKPACIKSTSTVATITHIVSMASDRSAGEGASCAKASAGTAKTSIIVVSKKSVNRRKSPSSDTGIFRRNIVYGSPPTASLAEWTKMTAPRG